MTCYWGISHFDDAKSRLPAPAYEAPDGQPRSSWRFRILPYLGEPLGREFYDAAWNAPINRHIASSTPELYCIAASRKKGATNIFAITGSGTAFDRGEFKGLASIALSDVPADLILLMEVADSKTHWMQPGDYDVAELLAATGKLGDTVKGLLPDRIHVLFADGEVWVLSPDAPMDALKPFLTIAAAKSASREKLLSRYRVND